MVPKLRSIAGVEQMRAPTVRYARNSRGGACCASVTVSGMLYAAVGTVISDGSIRYGSSAAKTAVPSAAHWEVSEQQPIR